MLNFLVTLQAFIADRVERDDKGATAVEYGLIVALIAAIIVGTVATLGQDVLGGFQTVETALT
jgi:pilus assembly protein Flp/PilA